MSKQKYPTTTTSTTTDGTKTVKKGREHYSHVKADAKTNLRRQDAEDRQTEHDVLTTAEKIEKAKSRRGESKREVARLTKKLEWEQKQNVVAKTQVATAIVVTPPQPEKKKRTSKSKIVAAAKAERPSKS